jgi:hypothetical protein
MPFSDLLSAALDMIAGRVDVGDATADDGLAHRADIEKTLGQRELRGVYPAHDGPPRASRSRGFLSGTLRRLSPHQFHYETGAPLLYWFGTQPYP